MSEILIPGGAGGITSSDVTATKVHILKGEKTVTSDSNDEVAEGTMTVNSLLSFSCAAYSGRRVLAKWQNPKAAKGKPYSGVYIRYSTSGYPGKTGGSQIYMGTGSNTVSEGQSYVYLDLPNLNTKYYLSIYPYVTCSVGEMTGNIVNTEVTTLREVYLTFKASEDYTINGFKTMDIFGVGGGGGGGGGGSFRNNNGSGGAGGYTTFKKGINVNSGETLHIIVGAGGTPGKWINGGYSTDGGTGGATVIGAYLTAPGGKGGPTGSSGGGTFGVDGGSGSGAGADYRPNVELCGGGKGGSNGGNGEANWGGSVAPGGKGQGKTTKAWGESSGTLYSGGGGGAGPDYSGAGGAGGGGTGANDNWAAHGGNGSVNTGGGGGGGCKSWSNGGIGGTGIVLIRLY